MKLEFEVRKLSVNKKRVLYDVRRKGLAIGMLVLPVEYSDTNCKKMEME